MKLRRHRYAQCDVYKYGPYPSDHNGIVGKFVSYWSDIIYIHRIDGKYFLEPTSKISYSSTTSKQVTWFLQEYFPDVQRVQLVKAYKTKELVPTNFTF